MSTVNHARYFSDEIGSTADQRPGALVAVGGQQRPHRVAAQPDGVPRSAVVGGDGDAATSAAAHGPPRVGRDERLVAEPDDDGVGAEVAWRRRCRRATR